MNYTECSFITRKSTARLSYRKPESVGTSSDVWYSEQRYKKLTVYTDGYDNNNDVDIGNNDKTVYY
jgi:hypothetical protein